MAKKPTAFISYSRRDSDFVRRLVAGLKDHGVSVFYDEADIAIGDTLVESIERAVKHAKYLLVVMSPDYFRSAWATKELELAQNLEFEGGQTKVLPILYRDCEIPPLLQSKVYADFRTDAAFKQSFPMLVRVPIGVSGTDRMEFREAGERKPRSWLNSAGETGVGRA